MHVIHATKKMGLFNGLYYLSSLAESVTEECTSTSDNARLIYFLLKNKNKHCYCFCFCFCPEKQTRKSSHRHDESGNENKTASSLLTHSRRRIVTAAVVLTHRKRHRRDVMKTLLKEGNGDTTAETVCKHLLAFGDRSLFSVL